MMNGLCCIMILHGIYIMNYYGKHISIKLAQISNN